MFAIGGNEEAARLAGINVQFVKTMVYVISGGCAATCVGMLLDGEASHRARRNTGIGSELQSIAAVVVGGTIAGMVRPRQRRSQRFSARS